MPSLDLNCTVQSNVVPILSIGNSLISIVMMKLELFGNNLFKKDQH